MDFERVMVIRDKTRLEQLIERFNSKAQAKFYIEASGGNFRQYETEHDTFYKALSKVQTALMNNYKYKVLFRSFLPTFLFGESDLILVLGQDGLVANTAKYVDGHLILAVNPDPSQYDGILLPDDVSTLVRTLERLKNDKHRVKEITMAEAVLHDGQRLLAFNDFYIGSASHVSSRYSIQFEGKRENQSSSGIIVSTGAGSTGWLSSVFNMANNVNRFVDADTLNLSSTFEWDAPCLMFAVREPFRSKVTGCDLGFGLINAKEALTVESKMASNGVIFSDGIEADFLTFNSGSTVEVGVAQEKARLIVS